MKHYFLLILALVWLTACDKRHEARRSDGQEGHGGDLAVARLKTIGFELVREAEHQRYLTASEIERSPLIRAFFEYPMRSDEEISGKMELRQTPFPHWVLSRSWLKNSRDGEITGELARTLRIDHAAELAEFAEITNAFSLEETRLDQEGWKQFGQSVLGRVGGCVPTARRAALPMEKWERALGLMKHFLGAANQVLVQVPWKPADGRLYDLHNGFRMDVIFVEKGEPAYRFDRDRLAGWNLAAQGGALLMIHELSHSIPALPGRDLLYLFSSVITDCL